MSIDNGWVPLAGTEAWCHRCHHLAGSSQVERHRSEPLGDLSGRRALRALTVNSVARFITEPANLTGLERDGLRNYKRVSSIRPSVFFVLAERMPMPPDNLATQIPPGLSVLEYLLEDWATVPPERGAFLATTWRMHENVCRFISDAVYDGRLRPEPHNQNQGLILTGDAHPALAPSAIRFVEVGYQGCAQKSEEEGQVIHEIYASLLRQRYRDRGGAIHPMTTDNILVVSPYNMQVNHLKSILPSGARVGTVDKFQGQEAEVVLISMATSSGEDLPRNIEFLFSKNRLNVAISRARCLAVIVASPALLEIPCRTVEELELVNTLCHAREYGDVLGCSK